MQIPGVSTTLKKWLVITQSNGWSLTHVYFGVRRRLQVTVQVVELESLGASPMGAPTDCSIEPVSEAPVAEPFSSCRPRTEVCTGGAAKHRL